MIIPSLAAILASALMVLLAGRILHQRRSKGHLPPGPIGLPIVGNVLDIPRESFGSSFLALSKKYGDIMYFNILGKPTIVLSSIKAVSSLLEKKSANFSSRQKSIVINMLGLDPLFVFMQYGPQWRRDRRAFHLSFGIDRISQYQPIQLKSARRLLSRLLTSTYTLEENLNILIADTSLHTIYGIDIAAEASDSEVYKTVETIRRCADALLLSSPFLEAFPFLRHLPSWLPGMQAKRTTMEGKRALHSTIDGLHAMLADSEREGKAGESMVTRLLEETEVKESYQNIATTAFIASADTTHSMMGALFLAAAMHPDKQKAVHDELDRVVGPDRLPEFSDYDRLPYTRAFIKELMRWHVVMPMGLPHSTVDADEHDGYFIPAGTLVYLNVWALSKDPHEYPDPHAFIPERFLGENPARDPVDYIFGFGRRSCPGRHFAAASLFIYSVSLLHVLDIMPPKDQDGNPVNLTYRTKGDFVSHINGYDYVIKPRSNKAQSLVADLAF